MVKYRLSNEAVKDLESIWAYTYEKWSVDQADRYYNLIINEIEYIVTNPFSGKPMDHIKEGFRASTVKSHLVFYKISKDQPVLIVRILHQRMNVKGRMK
ncbi:MAG: type II toxin-antitoxin system RelE/ParE family toxin [Bacteroidota bacterium]